MLLNINIIKMKDAVTVNITDYLKEHFLHFQLSGINLSGR